MSLDDLNREQKRKLRRMGALDEKGTPTARPAPGRRQDASASAPAQYLARGPRRDAQGRLAEAGRGQPLLDRRDHHGRRLHGLRRRPRLRCSASSSAGSTGERVTRRMSDRRRRPTRPTTTPTTERRRRRAPTDDADRRRRSTADDADVVPATTSTGDEADDRRRPSTPTPTAEAIDEESAEDAESDDDPWTRPGEWYVVHTQSGYEKKVTANLHARIQSMNMEEQDLRGRHPDGGGRRVQERPQADRPAQGLPRLPARALQDGRRVAGTASATRRASPGSSARAARARSRRRSSRREVETFLAAKGDGAERPPRAKPKLEYEVGESVRVKEGPFADFSGADRRDQRRPHEAQGAGQHLRARDARRDGLQPGRQALTTTADNERTQARHGEEESRGDRQDPDPGRQGQPGAARRHRPRPARRGDHGLRQAYNAATEAQVGTIVPVEITIFEDRTFTFVLKTPPTPVLLRQKAGLDKGVEDAGQGHGRLGHRGRHRRDRQDQDARPQRLRPRGGQAAGPRHRPLDGHRSRADRPHRQPTNRSTNRSTGTPRPAALTPRGRHHMSGKKYTDALKQFDRDQLSTRPPRRSAWSRRWPRPSSTRPSTIAVRLGVDPRKADQMVRGTVALPSGTGKDVRVAVFAAGEAAAEARDAGADIVGADDLAAAGRGGQVRLRRRHRHARHDAARRPPRPGARPAWPDAQPEDRHRHHRRRPRRRPSSRAARSSTAPTATATCTCRSARSSFEPAALEANFRAVLDELQRAKPASAKGRYLRKITVSSTMGPGVHVDTNRLRPEQPLATA